SEFLEVNTEPRAGDDALLLQLGHDVANHIHGNGKTDTLIAAASGKDCGIDSDQLTFCIDERAAGISGIDGRVGLNEILIVFDAEPTSSGGADDSHGHGLAEAKRVSDRERDVSN